MEEPDSITSVPTPAAPPAPPAPAPPPAAPPPPPPLNLQNILFLEEDETFPVLQQDLSDPELPNLESPQNFLQKHHLSPNNLQLEVPKDVSQQYLQQDLLHFISNNDVDGVQRLVDAGADVNYVDKFYSKFGRVNLTKDKSKKGPYIPGSEISGRTPLCFASKDGLERIVDILLKAGAKVNQHDE